MSGRGRIRRALADFAGALLVVAMPLALLFL